MSAAFVRRLEVLARQLSSGEAARLSVATAAGGKPGRAEPLRRDYFGHFETCQTRWEDQDCYRHVNNVVTYSFFDTAINRYLMHSSGFEPSSAGQVGFVVNSSCDYFKPFGFPSTVHVGIAVPGLAALKDTSSSVRYQLALFIDDADTAAAQGTFTHVWVDAASQRPVPIPAPIRQAIAALAPRS